MYDKDSEINIEENIKKGYYRFIQTIISMQAPLHEINSPDLKENTDYVFKYLSDREIFVLRMRFGLDDGKKKTLAELGVIMNITKERVRQIEKKAINKLRTRSAKLRQFLNKYIIETEPSII